MESAAREELERHYAELAAFCFRKLAGLEARFIVLCRRAQAAGVECEDLMEEGGVGRWHPSTAAN